MITADLPAGLTGDASVEAVTDLPRAHGGRACDGPAGGCGGHRVYLALWPLALLLMPTSGIDGEPNDAFN